MTPGQQFQYLLILGILAHCRRCLGSLIPRDSRDSSSVEASLSSNPGFRDRYSTRESSLRVHRHSRSVSRNSESWHSRNSRDSSEPHEAQGSGSRSRSRSRDPHQHLNRLLRARFRRLSAFRTMSSLRQFLGQPRHMKCQCGVAQKGKDSPVNKDHPDEQPRIVDGYEPKERPWMVYLQIASKKDESSTIGICAGSIINKFWVISAAHCFCMKTPCKKNDKNETVIDFVPNEDVRCVLGLKDMTKVSRYDELVYKPEKIIIHPDYFPQKHDHDDLALLRMEKEIQFSDKVMPICLPYGPKFPDTRGFVYVAGWGATHEPKCTTNEFGPMPNTKCKFPFKFKTITFRGCAPAPSPSNYEDVCNLLKNKEKLKMLPGEGVVQVDILKKQAEQEELISKCFNQTQGNYGWCATCLPNVTEPGNPGYCGKNATNDESEAAEASSSANWGFCNKHCELTDPLTEILQEVRLELVPRDLCASLAAKMNVSVGVELCAGNKMSRRKNSYLAENSTGEFTFELKDNGLADETYGGRDACTGDSGGPLWKWVGKRNFRVFLIGVVSRGKGCARRDAPGIYSRVKMYLEWIYSVAGDGKCK